MGGRRRAAMNSWWSAGHIADLCTVPRRIKKTALIRPSRPRWKAWIPCRSGLWP